MPNKSRSTEHLIKQQEEIRQKVNQFLKETSKARIVYPRKTKHSQQSFEIIREAKQIEEDPKQTPKLMSKFTSNHDAISNKKSLSQSHYDREQNFQRKSVLSKYQQPKIIESFAVQNQQKSERPNPQRYQRFDQPSRQSNRSNIKSQKHIMQKSSYKIDSVPSELRSSSARHNQRMFTQVVGKVGIRNHNDPNQHTQYSDLKGIHQFMKKKKNSNTSSILGKAYTEPPQRLDTIQEVGRSSSFKFTNPEKKKNGAKSETSSKAKLDLYIPFDQGGSYLPEIDKSRSVSKLFNRKMKTQASTPNFMKEDLKSEIKKKIDQKLVKQKSLTKQPSAKRLLQDYKYVIQKDDSQRIRQRSKPLLNEDKKQIKFLKIKEEMLGKIVLERVQKHMYQEKKLKANYITRVKSEKSIDQALVQFLKMKVKRADKALNQ